MTRTVPRLPVRLALTLFLLTCLSPVASARAPKPGAPPESRTGAARPAPARPTPPPRPTPPDPAHRTRQLEKRIQALETKLKTLQRAQEDTDVKQIIIEGTLESVTPKKEFKTKSFEGHARSLQGLNPEISITGDMAGIFYWSGGKEYGDGERSGFKFRGLGFHFQSTLIPSPS